MTSKQGAQTIWGVFVGEGGDHLEAFNSLEAPFPPKPGSTGYIAIRWGSIGNMNMWKGDYKGFIDKFRFLYPNDSAQALKMQANRVWTFAFDMSEGEYVICPSSASGYLLVGKIASDYISDYDDGIISTHAGTGTVFPHLRKVRWTHIIPVTDNRYEKLHRIGQLAVVVVSMKVDELEAILQS